MKNIFNLIFAIIVTLGISITTWARNPAAGEDRNLQRGSPTSGTLVLGSLDCDSCAKILNSNLRLPQQKGNFNQVTPIGTKNKGSDVNTGQ